MYKDAYRSANSVPKYDEMNEINEESTEMQLMKWNTKLCGKSVSSFENDNTKL